MTKWLKKLWFKLTYDEIAMKCRRPLGKSLFIFMLMSGICSAQTSILTADVNGVTRLHIRKRIEVEKPIYVPPAAYIGVPAPMWGELDPLTVTYRMYDSDVNQADGLTYYDSPSGGKYTHYVDWTANGATDSSNTYGKLPKDGGVPRRTIPQNLPAGSIVEVHDTTDANYTEDGLPYGNNYVFLTGMGTSEKPIFIRGVGSPVFTNMSMSYRGEYIIIEGFYMHGTTCSSYGNYNSVKSNYICIRNNENAYSPITKGSQQIKAGLGASNIVIYNNLIHHNGNSSLEGVEDPADIHGCTVTNDAYNIWILDNEIYKNDGDAIQIMGSIKNGQCPQYIYIAGNKLYDDRENAIDLKYSNHVIISQNEMYGYNNRIARVFGSNPVPRIPSGGTPAAYLPCNEGTVNSWFMFNYVHDCLKAAEITDSVSDDTPPNVYFIGNVITDIEGITARAYNVENDTWIGNIIYDVNCALWCYGTEHTSTHHYYNNIITKTTGGFTDIFRTYTDNYIEVLSAPSSIISAMRNNLFYDGGGWKWANTYYETVSALESAQGDYCSGNIEADLLFTDADNKDFTPLPSSPILYMEIADESVATFDIFETTFDIDIRHYVTEYFTSGIVYAPTGGL